MKTLNPNFPIPDEIVDILEDWYGLAGFEPLICWHDFEKSAYFVVVRGHLTGGIDMVRLFKMYDFYSDDPLANYTWTLSVDAQVDK